MMADFTATRKLLMTSRALIAHDRDHLKELSRKLVKAQHMMNRANAAYFDSLRFFGAGPPASHSASAEGGAPSPALTAPSFSEGFC
jgi:hypothetical protein